tara:strand:- start:1392 stop:1913 length:522 start_codon:yes stop_codon:yes gene_type:complete
MPRLLGKHGMWPTWRDVHFTYIMLAWCAAGVRAGVRSEAFCVFACLAGGCLASFGAAPLFDRSANARMARRLRVSLALYYGGHVALHVLPAVAGLALVDRGRVGARHGAAAALLHGGWGLLASGGTMNLDEVYVPMQPRHWRCMWLLAIGAELAWPALCQITGVLGAAPAADG